MEQLNKVELIGVVGTVRVQTIQDMKHARIQLATNYAYKDREGCPVVETTWHNVIAWEGRHIADFDQIQRGTNVKVVGRIRYQRYTDVDGSDRLVTEILASSIKIVD